MNSKKKRWRQLIIIRPFEFHYLAGHTCGVGKGCEVSHSSFSVFSPSLSFPSAQIELVMGKVMGRGYKLCSGRATGENMLDTEWTLLYDFTGLQVGSEFITLTLLDTINVVVNGIPSEWVKVDSFLNAFSLLHYWNGDKNFTSRCTSLSLSLLSFPYQFTQDFPWEQKSP